MVPEGLHGTALPRNSSQTSLSGAAPGGVLDTGPQSAALPRSSSQASLPRVTSSSALELGAHGKALPGNASSSSLAGAEPSSALEADKGSGPRAQGSSFKWPWQARKPGGAVRQLQASPQRDAPVTHPSVVEDERIPDNSLPTQLDSNGPPASAMAISDRPRNQASSRAEIEQADTSSMSNQANGLADKAIADKVHADKANADKATGLADKALNRIAAAQHEMHGAAPALDVSSWMKSNAGNPVSPRSGAFNQASSPQHNSRLRACAKSDRLRQLMRDGSMQRLQSDRAAEPAQHTKQGGNAAQGCADQPSHNFAAVADAPAHARGSPSKAGGRFDSDRQGGAEQPLGQGREDMPEGPQHASNPGSQAAALSSMAGSADIHRYQATVSEHLVPA